MTLFGTDGIRGTYGDFPITEDVVYRIGCAAAHVLGKRGDVFIIGKDTRESSDVLESVLARGLSELGIEVVLAGYIPTPAISYLVRKRNAEAGIMISASHNPFTDNGIKFFNKLGRKIGAEKEKEIEEMVLDDFCVFEADQKNAIHTDQGAEREYISFVKGSIEENVLVGLKLVIDTAHGAAFTVAPIVFEELGAKVVTLNNAPNGKNINENCGALHTEQLKKAVIEYEADAGIALDGDADRIIMVNEKGEELSGDDMISIAALKMIKNGTLKNDTVVVTHYSNLALDVLIEENGGKVTRVENGDKYIAAELEKSNLSLGGEDSGHIIFNEINPTGDGIVAGLQILSILQKSNSKLSELSKLKKNPQVLESIPVSEKKPFEEMPRVQEELQKIEKELGDSGRYILRYSGTEKKARVMIEGPDEKEIENMIKSLVQKIKVQVGA